MAASYMGYVLIGVGVVIILMTLVLGYGVYIGASNNINDLSLAGPTQNSNINGSISTLTNGIQVTATTGTYTLIEVAVLFLFASIGYKVSYLGIQMNNGTNVTVAKQGKIKGN
jgi:hypothetical protein